MNKYTVVAHYFDNEQGCVLHMEALDEEQAREQAQRDCLHALNEAIDDPDAQYVAPVLEIIAVFTGWLEPNYVRDAA